MPVKRTYSRRNMTMQPAKQNPTHDGEDNDDDKNELKVKVLSKKPSKRSARPFGGPISFQQDDDDIVDADSGSDQSSFRGKHPTSTFTKWVTKHKVTSRCNAPLANSGAEDGMNVGKRDDKRPLSSSSSTTAQGTTSHGTATPDSFDSFNRAAQMEVFRERLQNWPSWDEKNGMTAKPVPRRDIIGRHIRDDSPAHALWDTNLRSSRLLSLPESIKTRIYHHLLGNKIILIHHTSYRHIKDGNWHIVRRVFKYHCTTYDKDSTILPFRREPISSGMTLLNGVCRQLYHETDTLPHELNAWAFDSQLIRSCYTLHENRFSAAQRAAIKVLVVTDEYPPPNIIQYLSGLERVVWETPRSRDEYEVGREGLPLRGVRRGG